jgi:hypothetical protein
MQGETRRKLMALLYLVGTGSGVDEKGVPWTRGDDGAWRRSQEPRRPHQRLIRSETVVEERPTRAAAAGE